MNSLYKSYRQCAQKVYSVKKRSSRQEIDQDMTKSGQGRPPGDSKGFESSGSTEGAGVAVARKQVKVGVV
jgi:hypothetical protein